MAFCIHCGKKLGFDDKFCSTCGTPTHNKSTSSPITHTKEVTEKIIKSDFGKNFFEGAKKFRLTIAEKAISLRKKYIITDSSGNVIYTANSEGLPKIPAIGVYKQDKKIGMVAEELFANPVCGAPKYTIHWCEEEVASLFQKIALKLSFEVLRNGWKFDIGLMRSTVYDCNGAIVIQIQCVMFTNKPSFSVEYYNEENEVPAIMFALVSIMACHMHRIYL